MKPGKSNTTEPEAITFPSAAGDRYLCLPEKIIISSPGRVLRTRRIFRADSLGHTAERATVVITSRDFSAPPDKVWDGLMFYEQIKKLPPLLLRLLLPLPVRTEGRKSQAGDEVNCIYKTGYLVKRVTAVLPGREYLFDVIDQRLAFGRGIQLLGGGYALAETVEGITRVSLETRYVSWNHPRWLCKPVESWICHSFHRYILDSIYQSFSTGLIQN